jgi:subtilisin family serine protease
VKYLLYIFIFLFIGCGTSSYTTDTNNTEINTTEVNSTATQIVAGPIKEPLYYQQWAIEYNKSFYDDNYIDPNANIHQNGYLDSYGATGVKIAVIDDGLDMNHEDIKIYRSYSIINNDSNVSPITGDEDYHGTAVTGIIGARRNEKGVLGIAYNSDIIFLQMKSYVTDSDMIELFEKAKEYGAEVINCSWGTYDVTDAIKSEIQDLAINGRDGKGIIIVFAVGNEDKNLDDPDINDESEIPEVIAVGATDSENVRAGYSNYGSALDVMAPGGYYYGITTTDISGSDGYSVDNYDRYDDKNAFAGTSAAAPIVTGVIALMLERNPNLTREDIMDIIHNKSDKIGNLEYTDGRNDYYGYGKVNVNNYIQ